MHEGGKEFKPDWVEAEKWEEGCRVSQSTHFLPLAVGQTKEAGG